MFERGTGAYSRCMRRPEKCPRCGVGSIAEAEEQRWDVDVADQLMDDDLQGADVPTWEEHRMDVPFVMRRVRWTCQNCGWTDTGFSVVKPELGPDNVR
jgi:ribosomal protein S27AE